MPKLHLDTDIGGDIDDLCALAMVLNWPDVDLLAVTTNQDNSGRRAGYARYALRLAGRDDIPVAAGADASLDCYRIYPGLPDEAAYWPEPIPPAPGPLDAALDLLQRSIEQGAIIAAIGAYTNLALLEKRSPGILRNANLVLMGGYVFSTAGGLSGLGQRLRLERPERHWLGANRHRALESDPRPADGHRRDGAQESPSAGAETGRAAGAAHRPPGGGFCRRVRQRGAVRSNVPGSARRHHQLPARPARLRHRVGLA